AAGVLPALRARGQHNPSMRILRADNRRRLIEFDFGRYAASTAVPFGLALSQDVTERVLLDAAESSALVDVRFDSPLTRFDDDGGQVTAYVGDGTVSVVARYLVGADGAHSAVREQLGWILEGKTYPTRAFLADVDVAAEADLRRGWLADPRAASFTFAVRFGDSQIDGNTGGRTGGRWRLIESAIPDHVGESDYAERARALTERVFGAGAWRGTRWTSAYRKHERRAQRYHRGRVVLAGDAAHLNSPAGGQGLNTGLQDAFALMWRLDELVHGRGEARQLLGSYTDERTGSFDADVRPLTDGIERFETLPAWARRIVLSLIGVAGAAVSEVVGPRMSMLEPSAATSELLRGPSPVGRRMPDVVMPGRRRLFELVGPRGLLLHRGSNDIPVLPEGVAAAALPHGLPRPFAGHDRLFVRPDHLVALAGGPSDVTEDTILRALGTRSAVASYST
ncbi:MAG: FAD-dependent oxidoreductase, partial [Rhodoglobus sp.]